jgi:hypothetical protein
VRAQRCVRGTVRAEEFEDRRVWSCVFRSTMRSMCCAEKIIIECVVQCVVQCVGE